MIVRADLSPGLQLAQSGHALVQLCMERPGVATLWYERSNNLVVLQVPSEVELMAWATALRSAGCGVEVFREPDLDGAATAVAIVPCPQVSYLLSGLPLAGRVMAGSG